MDVYFIPVSPERHELYCEHHNDEEDAVVDEKAKGRLASIYESFKQALARVEQERLSGVKAEPERPRSWSERMKDRMLCFMAEKIAEQRLLWRLRNETEVMLHHPDDMPSDQATLLARSELQREADRHLKWVVIDGFVFIVSLPLTAIPGPNPISWYFGFRLVGHFLSRRGALHGLRQVKWQTCPNLELSRLRRVLKLAPHEREREVHEVASALHLPHLAKFFERTSVKTA
jgi:hypothetical protein